MSIRYGLLALLKSGPKYGYQLRGEFEDATGGTWPLNVGQVYTTLGRLERDGLVEPAGTDEDGRVRYRLTPAGDADVTGWLRTSVDRSSPPRNELAIKLALALTVPGADIRHLVQTQRTATLRTLQEYTRLKRDNADADLPWSLVLDSLIFGAEAEVRWLDHCEARLARSAGTDRRSAGTDGRSAGADGRSAGADGRSAGADGRSAGVGGRTSGAAKPAGDADEEPDVVERAGFRGRP